MRFTVMLTGGADSTPHLWNVTILLADCHPSMTQEVVSKSLFGKLADYQTIVGVDANRISIRFRSDPQMLLKFMQVLDWLRNPAVVSS